MAKETTSLPRVPDASAPRKTRQRREFADNVAKSVHIGQTRTTRAIQSINALRPLGNKRTYDLTDDQKGKILAALEKAVKEVREAFTSEAPVTGPRFAFE